MRRDHDIWKAPIVKTFEVNGHIINVRYWGTWQELCIKFATSMQQDRMRVKYPFLDNLTKVEKDAGD